MVSAGCIAVTPQPGMENTPSIASNSTAVPKANRRGTRPRARLVQANRAHARTMTSHHANMGGAPKVGVRGTLRGRPTDEAVVVTFTVIVVGTFGFKVTTVGNTLQVDFRGAPVQVREMGWLNPPAGASIRV